MSEENQKVLVPKDYFSKGGTGSNSRQWSKRYDEMYAKYRTLKEVAHLSDDLKLVLKGFELAIETFETGKTL